MGGANNNEVSTFKYILPLVFKHHPEKVHFSGAFILNDYIQI